MSTYEIKTGSRKGGYLDIKPGIEVIDKDESSLYDSNMIEMELGGMSDFYKNQLEKLEHYVKIEKMIENNRQQQINAIIESRD